MKNHPLISFFLITFLITWGLAGLFILFPSQIVALTMKDVDAYHPLFRFAISAPTVSAFLVILWRKGKQGLPAYWSRYLDLSVPLRWYALIFGGIVGFGFVLRTIEKSMGVVVPGLPFSLYSFIPFAIYWGLYDPGPLSEEGGWRGFALPLLQHRFSPFWAAIILGAVWSIFHLPAFYISTLNQSNFASALPLFLASTVALTLFMTYAYNATRGNIPLMIVIHWAYNLTGVLVPMDVHYFAAFSFLFLTGSVLLSRLRPAASMVEPIPGWPQSTYDSLQTVAISPGSSPTNADAQLSATK